MKFLAGLLVIAAVSSGARSCSLCNLNAPTQPFGCVNPTVPNPKLFLSMKYPLLSKLKLCLCNKWCGTPIPPVNLAPTLPFAPAQCPPTMLPCLPPVAPTLPFVVRAQPKVDLATLAYLLNLAKGCNAAPPSCSPLLPALTG